MLNFSYLIEDKTARDDAQRLYEYALDCKNRARAAAQTFESSYWIYKNTKDQLLPVRGDGSATSVFFTIRAGVQVDLDQLRGARFRLAETYLKHLRFVYETCVHEKTPVGACRKLVEVLTLQETI